MHSRGQSSRRSIRCPLLPRRMLAWNSEGMDAIECQTNVSNVQSCAKLILLSSENYPLMSRIPPKNTLGCNISVSMQYTERSRITVSRPLILWEYIVALHEPADVIALHDDFFCELWVNARDFVSSTCMWCSCLLNRSIFIGQNLVQNNR